MNRSTQVPLQRGILPGEFAFLVMGLGDSNCTHRCLLHQAWCCLMVASEIGNGPLDKRMHVEFHLLAKIRVQLPQILLCEFVGKSVVQSIEIRELGTCSRCWSWSRCWSRCWSRRWCRRRCRRRCWSRRWRWATRHCRVGCLRMDATNISRCADLQVPVRAPT